LQGNLGDEASVSEEGVVERQIPGNESFSCCRCDSTERLKALLPRLEQELKDPAKFKDLYQFTFTFAKNPGQKGLGEYHLPVSVSGCQT
jgi:hypothetical protein